MPIHIHLFPEDILEGKYLLQESRLLYFKALKSQENYIKIRKKELRLKAQLKSKIKILSSSIKFLHDSLPEIREVEMNAIESKDEEMNYSLVEQDLRDIQSNLKRIREI